MMANIEKQGTNMHSNLLMYLLDLNYHEDDQFKPIMDLLVSKLPNEPKGS